MNKQYTIVKDTREQNGWIFPAHNNCLGMVAATLSTGDYSILGLETVFTIERKGTIKEFARNIVEKRFTRELERFATYKEAFIILEFDMADILAFPHRSGIPPIKWPKLSITNMFILKRYLEIQMEYNVSIILAGAGGKEVASSIFKRMLEKYG